MMDDTAKEATLAALHESGKEVQTVLDKETDMSESYWSGLSPEEQLWAVCAIVRRLAKGELDENRSYRGILYDTFGWNAGAYVPAQLAGYMELHNSIYGFDDLAHVFESTLKELGIKVEDSELKSALAKHFY